MGGRVLGRREGCQDSLEENPGPETTCHPRSGLPRATRGLGAPAPREKDEEGQALLLSLAQQARPSAAGAQPRAHLPPGPGVEVGALTG